MNYYRKMKINGEIIVSRSYDIGHRTIKRTLPKSLKRKRLYWNPRTGDYYYNEEVVVGNVKFLGAYKDKACTLVQPI